LRGDFWLSCGHHLLDREPGGGLLITDDFLKAYLARPELAPPAGACQAERQLHARLLAEPRQAVAPEAVAAIADPDARENWRLMLAFRQQLLQHSSLEAGYLDLVRRNLKFPHLFLNQIVQVILRNLLDGSDDAFVARAAELFFRPQKLAVHGGALLAADEETISGLGGRPLSPLVSMLGLPASAEIDVLNDDNAGSYWERSDLFDMALDLTAGRRGLAALGEVIARWVAHLLAVEVAVEPIGEARGVDFAWYVGLDAQGTSIGNALWNEGELDAATLARIVGLYRLTFRDAEAALERARGEPIYLILAMTPDGAMRMKPQNLLTGLPIRQFEAVS
jgi:Family of unknown function (DUF6352)